MQAAIMCQPQEAIPQTLPTLSTEEKGKLIGLIVNKLRFMASQEKKYFDEGDTFFSLCFLADDDLNRIANLIL